MSMELVRQALEEIREREAAAIAARIKTRGDALFEVPTDQGILKEKAQRFIDACHQNEEASCRGWWERRLHGTVEQRVNLYFDHLEDDFLTPDDLTTPVNKEQPVYREMGVRTAIFGSQPLIVEDESLEIGAEALNIGWQVGFVEDREVMNPPVNAIWDRTVPGFATVTHEYKDGKKHIEPAENQERPVRIWQVVAGTAIDGAKIEKRELTHDISRRDGGLTIYDETFQDDEVRGFSANMFVLGIVQGAIEFVAQEE